MPFLLSLIALALTLSLAQAQATTSDPPYIYYVSQALGGVVIERADGTDSRLIGKGLVEPSVDWVEGPAWSADGSWFAWQTVNLQPYPAGYERGNVISSDGTKTLEMLDEIPCVRKMVWHPKHNILLVYGKKNPIDSCTFHSSSVMSYWIFDLEKQALISTFSIDSLSQTLALRWLDQIEAVQVLDRSELNHNDTQSLVTLYFNGDVSSEVIDQDTSIGNFTYYLPYDDNLDRSLDDSVIVVGSGTPIPPLTVKPPPHSNDAGAVLAGWVDSTNEWFLVGYQYCFAGCSAIGQMSIFYPETNMIREVANCGMHTTCIDWLPERVDIAKLPSANSTSVLPTPEFIDYEQRFLEDGIGYFQEVVSHTIPCAKSANSLRAEQVINIMTNAIDFVIPNAPICEGENINGEYIFPPDERVIFALSPDKRYFAKTNDDEYTTLYNAQTGEKIIALNFLGLGLSFSEDNTKIITTGRFATATWDIAKLVELSAEQ